MQRIVSREILDDDLDLAPQEIGKVLDDIWRINRWFGGVTGAFQLLKRICDRTGLSAVRILDVGAGDGRLASRLRRKMDKEGIRAEFVIVDRNFSHLVSRCPPSAAPAGVVADALELPFGEGSFDVVMSNLFLHHFSGEPARRLLRALAATAKHAVLMNDLDRRWLAYLFIRHFPFIARSRVSRLDGGASVRQAYTPEEMAMLAVETGIDNFEIIDLPFLRTGLIVWKSE
ncbi:MAG: methyltransferase domain-containing protein [Terriglobia bacterium]